MGKLIEILNESLDFKEDLSILEFFEKGFKLTDDDRFKTFELKYTPWIRTLCEWFDNYNIDWI
jgi:hypothetical protein